MELPEELKAQMGDGNPDKPYTKHELVLAYINRNKEVTVDELLVYLWAMTGKVTRRSYMHMVLKRLRDRNEIESEQFAKGKSSVYRITEQGAKDARPFKPAGVEAFAK